jgi:uncharacterized membrane protein
MSSPPPPPPPPPPSGGAPPPGWGGGAPPPPGGGAASGGGAPARYSVSEAFNYGWQKFQQNLGPWIGGLLLLFLVVILVQLVYQFIVGGLIGTTTSASFDIDPVTGEVTTTSTGLGAGFWGSLVVSFLLLIPVVILGMIATAQLVRAGLGTVDEGKIGFEKFFETRLLGPVVIAAIIAGLLTLVGVLACYVGSIIIAFFIQFYAYFVLGEEQSPWESIKSSFSFVNQHLANVIVLYLASALAVILGALACGVGLLIAYPVVLIAHAYTFRVLRGEPVAA